MLFSILSLNRILSVMASLLVAHTCWSMGWSWMRITLMCSGNNILISTHTMCAHTQLRTYTCMHTCTHLCTHRINHFIFSVSMSVYIFCVSYGLPSALLSLLCIGCAHMICVIRLWNIPNISNIISGYHHEFFSAIIL